MNRNVTVLLAIALALAVALVWVKLRYPGRAAHKSPVTTCDAALWDHVYEKERLEIIEPCTAVEGRVVFLHFNADGDVHIALDPDDHSVLNLVNAMHAHRQLPVEVICEHPATVPKARAQCEGFRSSVTLPRVNDHVRVTGAYVTDADNGWNEIHPVTRIEIIP